MTAAGIDVVMMTTRRSPKRRGRFVEAPYPNQEKWKGCNLISNLQFAPDDNQY